MISTQHPPKKKKKYFHPFLVLQKSAKVQQGWCHRCQTLSPPHEGHDARGLLKPRALRLAKCSENGHNVCPLQTTAKKHYKKPYGFEFSRYVCCFWLGCSFVGKLPSRFRASESSFRPLRLKTRKSVSSIPRSWFPVLGNRRF